MKFKVFVYSAAIILSISSCKPENILQVAPGAEIVTSCKAVHDSSGSYSSIEKSAIDVIYSLSGTGNYNDSIMVFDVTVLNPTEQAWQGIVKFELRVKSRQPWFFMPGYMYGDNKSPMDDDYMQKLWPRLEKGDEEIPYAPYFRVRSDRLSYPLSAVYSNNHVYAIAGSPYLITNGDSTVCWYPGKEGAFVQFNGMGCEIDSAEASVCYTLGYENAPWLYVGGKINKPATDIQKGSVSIGPGESLKLRLFVYSFEAEDRRGLNDVVKHQFALFHEEPRKVVSPEQAMKDLTEALYNDAYDKKARNYATVTRLVDGEVVRDRASFSIGWTGGMVVAAPLLLAAIRLDREDMREQALECIQDIVDNSLNEKSGLPYDAKVDEQWTTNGWWEHYLWKPLEGISAHSSYLSGQALFYILKAYEIEKEFKNTEHKDWLDFVIKVSDRIEKTKNQEHEYPYRWSPETGEAIDYDAMGGAWCLATRAYLASILDDSTMLLQSEQSIDHYWNKFVKQMNCYGTPHDVWMATEEEGVLAFVKAATILHQYTSNGKYLEYLRDGIDYEFTWKYCYNTVVLVPPLSKINWSSSGASGTSVANPHVHPMGNLIVDDVFYYANQTNDNYYRQRALDMVFWGLQSYNHVEGELDFGKKGWMSERHCPHQGLLLEKYPDGEPASVWFVYHSWASGCVLEGIAGTYWNEQSIN